MGWRPAGCVLAWWCWSAACVACHGVEHHDLADPPLQDAGRPDASRELDAGRPTVRRDAAADGGGEGASRCGGRDCACSNGLDDDGDGLLDGLDPECTAAFDDDEATFATGLPSRLTGCRDCFWDNNQGFGNDGCRYPAECLTGAAISGSGACGSCQVSEACLDACTPRTPNGCDCFGCCEVSQGADRVFIQLQESCQLAVLDDLAACPRCVPNTRCQNPCGRCELCLGKSLAELPADCVGSNGGPGYACDDGLRTCQDTLDCQVNEYCQLGCCLVDLL
ncbi:MAG: hypothetical protein ABW321_25650 [Polyangiales bacterium]